MCSENEDVGVYSKRVGEQSDIKLVGMSKHQV